MKTHVLYPLMFHPVYREAAWGGNEIARRYNRGGTPRPCAESWELSAQAGVETVVTNGPFEGISLAVIQKTFGEALLGAKAAGAAQFPLTVRLIDARERQPQVAHGAAGRRLWYVLSSNPGAQVWVGKPGTEALEAFDVAPGDLFELPADATYAIGGGNLLFEVCQHGSLSSEPEVVRRLQKPTTSHRDLHLRVATPSVTFATLDLSHTRTLHTTAQSLMVLFCAVGKTTLSHNGPHPLTLLPGDLVLVPPQQAMLLHPLAPKTQLLVTTL